jgi:hypothetical protein
VSVDLHIMSPVSERGYSRQLKGTFKDLRLGVSRPSRHLASGRENDECGPKCRTVCDLVCDFELSVAFELSVRTDVLERMFYLLY